MYPPTQGALLWALIRIPTSGLSRYSLILSNYCTFAHLLSFLGIEEQSAVIASNEIRPWLDLYVHFERPRPGPFN